MLPVAGYDRTPRHSSPRPLITFVADTVEAFVRAGDCPDAIGRVLNAGTGSEVSIGELVQRVAAVVDRPAPVVLENRRVRPAGSEVERLCANADAARDLLGWEPRVSLDEGLAATADWLATHLDRYRAGTYAI